MTKDSQREARRLDGHYQPADTRPLPHDELVQLRCFASQARLVGVAASTLYPPLPGSRGKYRPEPVPPETHRPVSDVDATLVQQILDNAERQRESDVHRYRYADNFGQGLEAPKRGALDHRARLSAFLACIKNLFALTLPSRGTQASK